MAVRIILWAVTSLCLINHISHWLFKSVHPSWHLNEHWNRALNTNHTFLEKLWRLFCLCYSDMLTPLIIFIESGQRQLHAPTCCCGSLCAFCQSQCLKVDHHTFNISHLSLSECSIPSQQSGVTHSSLLFASCTEEFCVISCDTFNK